MSALEGTGAGWELRPAGVGELLSRIWKLLRGDVWLYVKLAVLPVDVLAISEGALFWTLYRMGLFPPHAGVQISQNVWAEPVGIVAIMPLVMVAYSIYEGAACSAALATMRGARISFREAYGIAGRRAGRLIWMMFLRMAAVMAPWIAAIAVVLVAVAAMAINRGTPHPGLYFVLVPLIVLLYLGGLVWAIWISIHFLMGVPACMAEGVTAWNALKRSGQLSRGGKWRMFGVFFLVGLIAAAAVFAFEMIVFALLGVGVLAGMILHVHLAVPHTPAWIVPISIVAAAVFYLMIALQWASYAVTMTVLYQDQRLRSEEIGPTPMTSEPA